MVHTAPVPGGVDPSVPTPARIYDYMLRGRNYLEVDERAARQLLSAVPEIGDCAWSNRGFHQRAARWIASRGIRQFIDIGSGLPTVGNTHEVVQQVVPDARVVYVDHDPMVEAQGRALLTGSGTVTVLRGDLREPDAILSHPALRMLIDFREPAGVLMTAVLMFVSDGSRPHDLVARYLQAVAPGSYLALSHLTHDRKPPVAVERFRAVFDKASEHMHFRSREEIARFFDGLELTQPYRGGAPGLTYTGVWGAEDPAMADTEGQRWLYCGVGRRP